MISYLYLFASLLRQAFGSAPPVYFGRMNLRLTALVGIAISSLGLATVFFPSRQITSIGLFELKMFLTLGALLVCGATLFRYYSRRRLDPIPK